MGNLVPYFPFFLVVVAECDLTSTLGTKNVFISLRIPSSRKSGFKSGTSYLMLTFDTFGTLPLINVSFVIRCWYFCCCCCCFVVVCKGVVGGGDVFSEADCGADINKFCDFIDFRRLTIGDDVDMEWLLFNLFSVILGLGHDETCLYWICVDCGGSVCWIGEKFELVKDPPMIVLIEDGSWDIGNVLELITFCCTMCFLIPLTGTSELICLEIPL